MGVEVLHQNEGHAGIGRRIGQELFESREATGRGANAYGKGAGQEIVGSRLGRHHCADPFGERSLTARCPATI
jgi:hypothetical protein